MESREELRQFIIENGEALMEQDRINKKETEGSGDSDEEMSPDVHGHDIEPKDRTDTDGNERSGIMGIKAGSGKYNPTAISHNTREGN